MISLVVLIYVLSVAYIDLRTHRIPNPVSFMAALIGLMLQISTGGEGVLTALTGFIVGLGIFFPFYYLHAFGAGDVKAMATIGILLGPKMVALAAAFTLIAGGAIGVLILCLGGINANPTLYRLFGLALAPATLKRRRNSHECNVGIKSASSVQKFPYGIAIAVGTIAALLWAGRLQSLWFGQ